MRKKKDYTDFVGLQEIINNYGLDGRTQTSIQLSRLKAGLKAGGNAALLEIFSNNIALNLLIENSLTKEILKDENLLDAEGNLKPAISKDLMKLRADTLSYLKLFSAVQNLSEKKDNNSLANLLNDN